MASKSADWWTWNRGPWTGCKDLALAPEERSSGCRSCWLAGMLKGPRGKVIHGECSACLGLKLVNRESCPTCNGSGIAPPHEIRTHPGRLAQLLKVRKPQIAGWINGEVADVPHEFLAACVGVALARPDHGFGVPTSDPAGVVEFCRWVAEGMRGGNWRDGAGCLGEACRADVIGSNWPMIYEPEPFPPPNWLWLISASNQQELDERAPYAAELARMGWRVGLHLEPLLSGIEIPQILLAFLVPRHGGELLTKDSPDVENVGGSWIFPLSWVGIGAPKGHVPSDIPDIPDCVPCDVKNTDCLPPSELDWYRDIIAQCEADGVPCWLKSPTEIDGIAHRELPEGWQK